MDQTNNSSGASGPSGPKKVNNVTVVVDRNLCIGAASCVAVAPKTFALDNEAKAIILDTATEDSLDTIMDAAKSCPVAAIIIHDDTGKQLFP
ncbi:ferredoxin [Patescibacteria group bacterium]|nr:ferredoxin [Patescibacteria group bacterium]MCL5797283.1 ferredoxin [Patescibacteria group bacterium]